MYWYSAHGLFIQVEYSKKKRHKAPEKMLLRRVMPLKRKARRVLPFGPGFLGGPLAPGFRPRWTSAILPLSSTGGSSMEAKVCAHLGPTSLFPFRSLEFPSQKAWACLRGLQPLLWLVLHPLDDRAAQQGQGWPEGSGLGGRWIYCLFLQQLLHGVMYEQHNWQLSFQTTSVVPTRRMDLLTNCLEIILQLLKIWVCFLISQPGIPQGQGWCLLKSEYPQCPYCTNRMYSKVNVKQFKRKDTGITRQVSTFCLKTFKREQKRKIKGQK